MQNKLKRVLFVLPTDNIGGTRTSLINLLSNMDKSRYDIDVLFMLHRGSLREQFKQHCRVLPQDRVLLAGRESLRGLLKSGRLWSFLRGLGFAAKAKLKKEMWYESVYRKAAKKYGGKYDCVIAFQEKDATEFARYIDAPRKIAWVHTDYSRSVRSVGEERFSYLCGFFDRVVFVSDACLNQFKENAHIDADKMLRIYNTFDTAAIIEKSGEFIPENPTDRPVFVSVGRFCEEKSFDRAVEVAKRLKDGGYSFKWYIIGDGELFCDIQTMVAANNLEGYVELTGRKSNPYPYIKAADAMILTSIVESHPMVANEAFILSVPVVSAGFSSAKESVVHLQNGILCQNSTDSVYEGVKSVLDNPDLLKKLKANLKDFSYDNLAIVKQVEALIEGKL